MASVKRSYDQGTLLSDNSMQWKGYDRENLSATVRGAIEIWKPHNFGDGRSYRERFDEASMKTAC